MIGSQDMEILAKVLAEMEEEQGSSFSLESVNIAELQRRTGIPRQKLRTLKKNGFKTKAHGNAGKKREETVITLYEPELICLMKDGVVNSSVCFERLKEIGYAGGLTTVKNFIAAHKDIVPAKRHVASVSVEVDRARRYTTGPGDCFHMDWGFVKVTDTYGNTWNAACFAMVCHHCGLRYVEFFPNATQENLFIGMLHAFTYMGIPKRILTDNMKSVTTGRDSHNLPIWNSTYASFQELVGFHTELCKVAHPFTKGSVERLVRFVKENFVAGRKFYNVNDLNSAALQWCIQQNAKLQTGLGVVPEQVHATEPLSALAADDNRYIPFLAPVRRISYDGMVTYEGRRYGVPLSYTRHTVRVLRNRESLRIIDDATYITVVEHTVDWSKTPHYCEGQFEELLQPEEHPTAPVKVFMSKLDGTGVAEGFEKFNY